MCRRACSRVLSLNSQYDDTWPTNSFASHSLGDTLRDEDAPLCQHREATKLAWKQCSEGDHVFIKRSGGKFTYARCEGYDADEPTALSFAVDNKGHFKVVGEARWSKGIKVPAVENVDGTSGQGSAGGESAGGSSATIPEKVQSDDDILRLATATSAGNLRQRMNEMANPNRSAAVDRSGLTRRGSMPSMSGLTSVPESSRVAGQTSVDRSGLTRRGSMPTLGLAPVPESSKVARQMSAEANLLTRGESTPSLNGLKRRSSKSSVGTRSRGNLSGQMHPTMENIQENSVSTPSAGANVSWNLVGGTAQPSENPLLRMMAEREKAKQSAQGMSPAENPLLRMMDERNKKKSEALEKAKGQPTTRRKWALGSKCPLSKNDVREISAADMTMAALANNIQLNEGAFIRRSDGNYRYAILASKTAVTMTFQVTEDGKTKKIDVVNAGKDVIPEQIVIAKGGGAVQDSSDGAARAVEQFMTPSTPSSNSLATMQRRGSSSGLMGRRAGSRGGGLSRTVSELSGRTAPRNNTMRKQNSSFDLIRPSSEPDGFSSSSAMKKTTKYQLNNDRKDKVKFVSCRTEDGKTQVLPLYSEGLDAFYKSGSVITPAKILKAHQDDLLVPYYTIKISTGKEKQTTGSHIFLTKAEALQEVVEDDKFEDDDDDTAASSLKEKDAVFDDAEVKKFNMKWC